MWYASVLVCLTRRRAADEGSKESEHVLIFRGVRHTLRQLSQHDALDQVVQVTAEEFVSRFSPRLPGLAFCISLKVAIRHAGASKRCRGDIRRVTRCGRLGERARERERNVHCGTLPKKSGKEKLGRS